MGTETRVGIVAGLLIVVVASVYFFYGSRHDEDDLLLTQGPQVSQPVKIPPSQDAKTPVARRNEPTAGLSPARRQVLRPPVQQPARPTLQPPLYRSSTQPAVTLGRPGPAGAVAPGASMRMGNTGFAPTTPLRTGPSNQLVDATNENLSKPTSPPVQPGRPAGDAASSTGTPGMPALSSAPIPKSTDATDAPWPKRHKVESGDTLEAIAQQYYDDPRKVATLLAANPQLKPRHMRIGEIVLVPAPAPGAEKSGAAKKAESPETAAPKVGEQPVTASTETYRVEAGDTFNSIAFKVYNNKSKWSEIYRLNKELVKSDPKRLRPGMVLKLPPK